jgi:two-component system sensor histidine kinase BaeS
MNLKLQHKVFLAFLLNSSIVIVCILLIGRYFAERHFQEYVGKVEAERTAKLVEVLSQQYRKQGSWDSLLKEPGFWSGLRSFGPMLPPIHGPMQDHAPPPQLEDREEGVPAGGPDSPMPPPPEISIPLRPAPHSAHPDGQLPHGPPPAHHHGQIIALFDADRRPLTPIEDASSPDSYNLTPIDADGRVVGWLGIKRLDDEPVVLAPFADGRVVGWLGSKRRPRPTHHLDVEFMERESETFYVIGSIALALAVLVTFVLSRHLLAPVKELEKGTKALSFRKFDTQIVVKSHDELGRLATGFNEMARALYRHQQTQQQWLVDISHELRTPLAILRGEIEAMQDGIRTVTSRGLDSLHHEVLHLSRIVTDLHDLSLIESRSFNSDLSAVNPFEILMETLECFRTRLDQRGIGLDVQEAEKSDVLITADADRLKQLFSNIMENSLRYTNVPGILRVLCRIEPGEIMVSLEDSGPGVPPESLAFLFDRLYRVDGARSREHGGSGLGLAICKSIVESFGGKIEASNIPDAGLRICMRFPLANPQDLQVFPGPVGPPGR